MKNYEDLSWSVNEYSSCGQDIKTVKADDRTQYFYKVSDYKNGHFLGHEAKLEVIASRLGNYLGFPVLKYAGEQGVLRVNDRRYLTYVARSKSYRSKSQSAVPIATMYEINKRKWETPLEFCRRYGMDEYLNAMFLFDYLIINTDRHGQNTELLFDADGEWKVAPLFDNGRCLTSACGGILNNIRQWDYTTDIAVNNFIGSLYLERNLRYVTQPHKVPELNEAAFRRIFYGFGVVMHRDHIEILKKAILYRYNTLRKLGLFV